MIQVVHDMYDIVEGLDRINYNEVIVKDKPNDVFVIKDLNFIFIQDYQNYLILIGEHLVFLVVLLIKGFIEKIFVFFSLFKIYLQKN